MMMMMMMRQFRPGGTVSRRHDGRQVDHQVPLVDDDVQRTCTARRYSLEDQSTSTTHTSFIAAAYTTLKPIVCIIFLKK